MDPARAPREAPLSTALTGEPAAAAACCAACGQRSGESRAVLSQRHGPPRRVDAERYRVPSEATQGNS